MGSPRLDRLSDVYAFDPGAARLFSATHEEILSGKTTDIYFVKTRDILDACGRPTPPWWPRSSPRAVSSPASPKWSRSG